MRKEEAQHPKLSSSKRCREMMREGKMLNGGVEIFVSFSAPDTTQRT